MRKLALRLGIGALAAMAIAAGAPAAAQEATGRNGAGLVTGSLRSACGPIVVAEFAWRAAELASALLERLIRDGYECATTRAPASPDRALELLGTGVEISGEYFGETASAPTRRALMVAPGVLETQAREAAGVAVGAQLYEGGEKAGWYAPSWLLDANPEIRTLTDAAWKPELFAARPGARPRIHLCPTNWSCRGDSLQLAERLRLSDRFEVIEPLSGDALTASLIDAFAARAPWIGFYWSPSAILAEYPMRRLEPGEVEICEKTFRAPAADAPADAEPEVESIDCREPFLGPRQVVAYSEELIEKAPRVAGLLDRFALPAGLAQEAMAWKIANGATMGQTARHLFRTYPELWRSWLDPKARARFERALVAEVRNSD